MPEEGASALAETFRSTRLFRVTRSLRVYTYDNTFYESFSPAGLTETRTVVCNPKVPEPSSPHPPDAVTQGFQPLWTVPRIRKTVGRCRALEATTPAKFRRHCVNMIRCLARALPVAKPFGGLSGLPVNFRVAPAGLVAQIPGFLETSVG